MRALVTGSAGFIGSHLAERLVALGWEVVGVDDFTSYYDQEQKRHNLDGLVDSPAFRLVEADLSDPATDLDGLIGAADVVFHQAGQPGVRASWDQFDSYVRHNIEVTNRMLLAARDHGVDRFVYASSSSIYGDADQYPTSEDVRPQPVSPYGVTKLAGEHLCGVFARNYGVPTVALRYFTVYGPRQRPDMGMHRLIEVALGSGSFPLFGDGTQVRDFTYVDDVVEANLRAATEPITPGLVVNVAGGGAATLLDVIAIIEGLTGQPVVLDPQGEQPGDVVRTGGDTRRAAEALGWKPMVSLEEGLARQVEWHRSRRDRSSGA